MKIWYHHASYYLGKTTSYLSLSIARAVELRLGRNHCTCLRPRLVRFALYQANQGLENPSKDRIMRK